jgi:hypothetical protein
MACGPPIAMKVISNGAASVSERGAWRDFVLTTSGAASWALDTRADNRRGKRNR